MTSAPEIVRRTAPPPQDPSSELVISYLGLRRAVGFIGMALPFVLAIGKGLLDGGPVQPSVSDYYYTVMRDVLVGSLCAIGVFLGSYRGYDWRDRLAGNVGCAFAIAVALFPTTPDQATTQARIIGMVHYTCAAGLFVTLAAFCRLFRETGQHPPTDQKLQRNRVYAVCGLTILACIALILLYSLLLRGTSIARLAPVFWLEALAVFAFGVSWLTKGEAILKDK